MDPKMDSGVIPPGDTFDSTFDISQPIEAPQLIWIMDQLLCLEIAWHEGHPLSQTVFTSLHIDRLLSPETRAPFKFPGADQDTTGKQTEHVLLHTVFHAYCVGLIKCCQLVLHTIQSQNFYEEEDFVTHLFGRELLPTMQVTDAIRALDDAMSTFTTTVLPTEAHDAVMIRLQMRRSFLTSLIGEEDRWALLKELTVGVQQSHKVSQALPEAFSDKVQRKLATSTPPRPMLVQTWDEACGRWTKLFDDIVQATESTDFWVCQSPHALQRAIWAYASRSPPPNTFARAYMQDTLFGNERIAENLSHFDLLLTDLRDLVLAGDALADPESFQVELPSDPRHQCSRLIEGFMDKVFDEYLNLYRMVCQNRCRIRRTFTQAINVFETLEGEAETAERGVIEILQAQRHDFDFSLSTMKSKPFVSWVKYYKLLIMAQTIQLGIETDIYLPHELASMYWLLAHFTQLRRDLLDHLDTCVMSRMKSVTARHDHRHAGECLATADWLASLKLSADATIHLSRALWRFYSILLAYNIIQTPKGDYATALLLYDARMKPYLGVTRDAIPSLEQLRDAQNDCISLATSCKAITADVKDTKLALSALKNVTPLQGKYVGTEAQWKAEIRQLEMTSVAVSVQVSQLQRLAPSSASEISEGGGGEGKADTLPAEVLLPPPGKRYHDWWLVPQVKERKR